MAEHDLLTAFNDCVDRMGAGQSLDDCLKAYPQHASTLGPMLETGQQIRSLRVSPTEVIQARERTRYRFENAIRSAPSRRSSYPLVRFASLAAAVLMIFFIVSSGASLASQSSLPGDPLYGLKRLTEQIRLSLSGDPALASQFDQRRVDETKQLLQADRSEEVIFQGDLSAMNGDLWTIAGLPVQITSTTAGVSSAHIGDQVEVHADTTSQGQLIASAIVVISTATPQPTASPAPTLVPTTSPMTRTPTFTTTPVPSHTPRPTITPSATATITPSMTATIAPLVSPTFSPTLPVSVTLTATTCLPTKPDGWEDYHIQSGDTLSGLASSRGISLNLLMSVNCIAEPGMIVAGEQLFLPPAQQPSPTLSNSGPGGNQPITATDDHGGDQNPGSGSSSSGDGSNTSGDDHGGSGGGDGGDGSGH